MLRSIVLLVTGAAVGAIAISFVIAGRGGSSGAGGSSSIFDSVTNIARGRDSGAVPEGISVAERLSAYESAQAETDPVRLERRLGELAAQAWSVGRDLELDAVLARIAAISAARAVELALAHELERGLLADVWLNWAETEPDAALAALATIDSMPSRRDVALVLLDVFGDDLAAVNRILTALPDTDHDTFVIEWLTRLAETDFYAAFREAQVIVNPGLQRRALTAVAESWAAQDPLSALAQADILPEDLARTFRSGVVSEWARLDAGGYLAYLESTPSPTLEVIAGISILTATDPQRLIDIAGSLSGDLGRSLMSTALRSLAESDPNAAMERLSAVPPGQERNTLVLAIGSALARQDADAALEWVRNLSPPSPDALRSVAMEIAQNDFDRALEMIDDPIPGVDIQLVLSVIASQASRYPEQSTSIASRLAARDDLQSAATLAQFVSTWIGRDPERALEWVLANGAGVDAGVFGRAAMTMASQDPVAAAALVERIPEAHRSTWINQVATQYGSRDPDGAVAWISQYQGTVLYDQAVRQVIVGVAQADPRRAANLMAQAGPEAQLGVADRIAASWAQQEPRAASLWSADLTDQRAREAALRTSTGVWYQQDPAAAKNWVLNLRSGEARDAALVGMLQRGSSTGNFDRGLLNAMDSDSARQEALRLSIPMIARTNASEARALLDEVTSAETRRQIEQTVEQLGVSL